MTLFYEPFHASDQSWRNTDRGSFSMYTMQSHLSTRHCLCCCCTPQSVCMQNTAEMSGSQSLMQVHRQREKERERRQNREREKESGGHLPHPSGCWAHNLCESFSHRGDTEKGEVFKTKKNAQRLAKKDAGRGPRRGRHELRVRRGVRRRRRRGRLGCR